MFLRQEASTKRDVGASECEKARTEREKETSHVLSSLVPRGRLALRARLVCRVTTELQGESQRVSYKCIQQDKVHWVSDKVFSRFFPVDYLPIYFGEELPLQCGSDNQEQFPQDTELYGNMAWYTPGPSSFLDLDLVFAWEVIPSAGLKQRQFVLRKDIKMGRIIRKYPSVAYIWIATLQELSMYRFKI